MSNSIFKKVEYIEDNFHLLTRKEMELIKGRIDKIYKEMNK